MVVRLCFHTHTHTFHCPRDTGAELLGNPLCVRHGTGFFPPGSPLPSPLLPFVHKSAMKRAPHFLADGLIHAQHLCSLHPGVLFHLIIFMVASRRVIQMDVLSDYLVGELLVKAVHVARTHNSQLLEVELSTQSVYRCCRELFCINTNF